MLLKKSQTQTVVCLMLQGTDIFLCQSIWMSWVQMKTLAKRVQKTGIGDTYEIIISYLNV